MIESRVFLTSEDEETALKKFTQNRLLKKRAALVAGKNDVDIKELRALRKKVAVLEVAQHSLQHKLRTIRA